MDAYAGRAGALARALGRLWQGVRSLTGDDAYERYCAHQRLRHPGVPPLSRREFCAEAQRRKWGGVTRCC